MKISRAIVFLIILLISGCNKTNLTAYVNPNKLMQGYHGAAAQHEVFQAKAKEWQQRIDSLLEAKINDLEIN